MPNECMNQLRIEGNENDIKELKDKLFVEREGMTELTWGQKLLVDPYSGDENWGDPKEGAKGYNWCLENWGTKWDAMDTIDADLTNDNSIYVYFTSAWSPPIEAFDKIGKMYPNLTINLDYYEPSMDFIGNAVFQDGETYDESWEPTLEDHLNWNDEFYVGDTADEYEVYVVGMNDVGRFVVEFRSVDWSDGYEKEMTENEIYEIVE